MPSKLGSKYDVTSLYDVTSFYSDAEIASQLLSHPTLTRDVELADFIDERMPLDRKRQGVPKSLLYDAKDKFGLSSKSSILRAYARGKKWKSDAASIGFEIGKRNPRR